jgi:hypothetical protein
MEEAMRYRSSIGLIALAVALSVLPSGARALDDLSKYPDLKGQWQRIGPNRWESATHKAPLTPEYKAVYEDNLARMEAGGVGDMASWYCLPQGMPMMMSLYDPMEIVVTPEITYILISHVNDSYRRIYTDGRDWPAEGEYELTFAGYSIGRWIEQDGDGRYTVLEAETRGPFQGPRAYDASGLPLHFDNQSIFKERFHLDQADPNVLHDETTVIDHALTRPWSVDRRYTHNPNPLEQWPEVFCVEGNVNIVIGKENYIRSADGFLMPTKKNQAPPDLRYFKQTQK